MSYSAMRRKRFTAGVLAGAMALTVTPILGFTGIAGADHLETAEPIGDDNVCEDAPETDPFTDVTDEDPAVDEIRCLVNTEPQITEGTGDGTTYSPNAPVTRRQMALFLERVADLVEANETSEDAVQALPEGDGETPFTDIGDEAAEIQNAIDRLHEAGITDGVTATEFMPAANVTRRQMAKFIVDLQAYVAGEDFAPEATEDYFGDDEGDTGEEELNILAEEGVFIGADDEHNVEPGENITRRQMASVLTRKLEVFFEGDVITRLFAEDDSNETLDVTPDEATSLTVANEAGATPTADDRQYTASGLTAGTTYTIQLFPAGNVTEDGVVTFEDSTGTAGLADEGTVAADITVVNGTAVGAPDADATASPVNGQITFTVDGDSFESVIPVVFADADNDGGLDLDADDQPTEDFGVGGATLYLPAEAASGTPLATDADVAAIFDNGDGTYAVVLDLDPSAAVGAFTLVEINANDQFYIDDDDAEGADDATVDPEPAEQVTAAAFIAELSVGDEYDVDTVYQATDEFASMHVLEDVAPGAPTLTATGDQGNVDLDITPPAGFDADDTITVQRATVDDGVDNTCGTIDDVLGTFSTVATVTAADDEDAATPAVIDYTDTVAPGCYSYRVSATVDGETSDNSAPTGAEESTADVTDPSMTSATANDVNDGIGTTNQVVVVFSEAVSVLDNGAITVHPAGQPGLVFTVTASAQANTSGTAWLLTLSGPLNDAAADVTYQVDSAAGAYEDASGNDNIAEDPDTTFDY